MSDQYVNFPLKYMYYLVSPKIMSTMLIINHFYRGWNIVTLVEMHFIEHKIYLNRTYNIVLLEWNTF